MNLALIFEDNQEGDMDQMMSDANPNEGSRWMERNQEGVRGLLTVLSRLSTGLFAAIGVVERQITVLQDLHSLLSTSCLTKTRDSEKGPQLRRNPFHKSTARIPILPENSEQIWPNTLETINEVVRERESFIEKVKGLVENMEIRRKIV